MNGESEVTGMSLAVTASIMAAIVVVGMGIVWVLGGFVGRKKQ
jgi:hypothetical protein